MNPLLEALGWVGESLDKPGAAVRGFLAGRPDQLLNLIPFSDTRGWTNPEERTSGRDLLEKVGLLGENTEGLDFGDVAGAGVEMLLDPTAWLGGAAIKSLKPWMGPRGAGVRLRPAASAGTKLEALSPAGRAIGEVELMPGGLFERRAASTKWPGVVGEKETIGRVGDIALDPEFHGYGIGQQMYLDAMNKSPTNWWYNSGNSPDASQALEALRRKGLADIFWDTSLPTTSQIGGPRIMRITPSGRAAAESGEVLKPMWMGPRPPYGALLSALGGEQALARMYGF